MNKARLVALAVRRSYLGEAAPCPVVVAIADCHGWFADRLARRLLVSGTSESI